MSTDTVLARSDSDSKSLSPHDERFAKALDESIQAVAHDIAAARDEILLGSCALAFQALSEGETVTAAEFLRVHYEVEKEFAEVLADEDDGHDRRQALGVAVANVAAKMIADRRGDITVSKAGKVKK